MKEFFNAPEGQLSFEAAIEETLQFDYTQLRYQDINIPLVRSQLGRDSSLMPTKTICEECASVCPVAPSNLTTDLLSGN